MADEKKKGEKPPKEEPVEQEGIGGSDPPPTPYC